MLFMLMHVSYTQHMYNTALSMYTSICTYLHLQWMLLHPLHSLSG